MKYRSIKKYLPIAALCVAICMTAGCSSDAEKFISEGIEAIGDKVESIEEAKTSGTGQDDSVDSNTANTNKTDAETETSQANKFESDNGVNSSLASDSEFGAEENTKTTSDSESGTTENNKTTNDPNANTEENTEASNNTQNSSDNSSDTDGLLTSVDDIDMRDIDGAGTNYEFTYNGEKFSAIYTADNWKIINSYKIDNISDMVIICEALSEAHPIHGSDLTSFRTAEDMAYEWTQHNLAYDFLNDGDSYKEKAKDVDLNPEDQNKSFDEIYKDRTGKELSLEDILNRITD